MSGSSVSKPLGDVGTTLGKANSDIGAWVSHPFDGLFGGNSAPASAAPPAPPSAQTATTKALNDQLNQELQMRNSKLLYSGSGGLLDSTPKTAGTVLLGS